MIPDNSNNYGHYKNIVQGVKIETPSSNAESKQANKVNRFSLWDLFKKADPKERVVMVNTTQDKITIAGLNTETQEVRSRFKRFCDWVSKKSFISKKEPKANITGGQVGLEKQKTKNYDDERLATLTKQIRGSFRSEGSGENRAEFSETITSNYLIGSMETLSDNGKKQLYALVRNNYKMERVPNSIPILKIINPNIVPPNIEISKEVREFFNEISKHSEFSNVILAIATGTYVSKISERTEQEELSRINENIDNNFNNSDEKAAVNRLFKNVQGFNSFKILRNERGTQFNKMQLIFSSSDELEAFKLKYLKGKAVGFQVTAKQPSSSTRPITSLSKQHIISLSRKDASELILKLKKEFPE